MHEKIGSERTFTIGGSLWPGVKRRLAIGLDIGTFFWSWVGVEWLFERLVELRLSIGPGHYLAVDLTIGLTIGLTLGLAIRLNIGLTVDLWIGMWNIVGIDWESGLLVDLDIILVSR